MSSLHTSSPASSVSLERLVYTSIATEPMGTLSLFNLLNQARQRNARLGLTGHLLYADGRFTQKRIFHGVHDGQFELLQLPAGEPLRCRLSHPRLTHVDFATSFVPSECPVWGNGNTFSIEPYLAASLAPGATLEWHVSYDFGAAR